jgi:hypothetical protein
VPVRFETHDRVQLLGRIAHIDPVARFQALRDPEEAMKAHDVIDPKKARVPELMSEAGDNVAVTLLPNRLRMERRKAPILPLGKDDVRRGTPGYAQDKGLALTPDVVAIRVDPEGKIKIEAHTRTRGML